MYASTRCRIRSASCARCQQTIHAEFSCLQHTCWFMSNIAMSFLSSVNRSNADSMVLFSVFWSTTRKFFCESGGGLTC